MNLRELYAFAVASGDLTHDPLVETGADRIGAVAFSDPLGAALWRVLVDHDAHAWIAAREILRKRMSDRHDNVEMYRRVADLTICEWMAPNCTVCNGRKYLGSHGEAKVACRACAATGIGRHSDSARAKALGIERRALPPWEKKLAQAHNKISVADSRAGQEVQRQLERGWRKAA